MARYQTSYKVFRPPLNADYFTLVFLTVNGTQTWAGQQSSTTMMIGQQPSAGQLPEVEV